MDGDDKPQPTEMDKLLEALAARGLAMDGKPITAEMVLPLIVGLMGDIQALRTTIGVLKKM